jgi:hypothetical protein
VVRQNGLLNVSQGPAAKVRTSLCSMASFFSGHRVLYRRGSFVTPVATVFRVAVGGEPAKKRADAVVRQSDMGLHDFHLNVRMSAC